MQAAPELLSTTMQISAQLEWPTMNNEQNDCFIYHHDRILKGRLFGRVDREMCLLWLFFSRAAAWMFLHVSSGCTGTNRNDADQDGPEWLPIWSCHIGEVVFYAIVRNFITPLHCNATLFVQNRFVMYITRGTGTSVLCISIVYVHNANDFINTTATLLCLRKIDKYIYMLCT